MSNEELEKYIADCLNAGLDADAEQSSLTNSFKIIVDQDKGYFDFVPAFPGTFRLTKELSDSIQTILSGALFPYATLLAYPSVNLVDETSSTSSLHLARGLRFYFLLGGSKRVEIESLDSNLLTNDMRIRLQENTYVTPYNCPALAINGQSGSGKSILANILISGLLQYINCQRWDWNWDFMYSKDSKINSLFDGKLVNVIDPKLDLTTYHFAEKHSSQVNYFSLNDEVSNSEFLSTINSKEADFLKVMHFRQLQKLKNPWLHFAPLVLSIDELQFATSAVSRQTLNTFQSLTDRIILTARSSSGFLMLQSQSMPIPGSISTASRDGLTYKIILGRGNNVSKQDTRFLLKDFDLNTVALNPDGYAFGNGLFQDAVGLVRSFKTPLVRRLI